MTYELLQEAAPRRGEKRENPPCGLKEVKTRKDRGTASFSNAARSAGPGRRQR